MKNLGFGCDSGIANSSNVMTGAMYEMLQPTAWEIHSDTAVPNARRKTRVLAILESLSSPATDVVLVGIRQQASNSDIQRAQRIEEPAVTRVDNRRGLCADL